MRSSRALGRVAVGLTLVTALAGCNGSGRSAGKAESVEQFAIAEVGQVFHAYQKGKKPPPKGLADLGRLQMGYPAAFASIRSKDVLVYWGAGLSDDPDAATTVLAYHKDVPETGGEVLMQDGTARRMTADEFKAAKKPEGASTDLGTTARKK